LVFPHFQFYFFKADGYDFRLNGLGFLLFFQGYFYILKLAGIIKLTLVLMPVCSLSMAQGIRVGNENEAAFRCFVEADIISTVEKVGISTDNIGECNRALEDDGLSTHDRAATLANRGILHAAKGELAEALSDYDEALSISPELAEVYLSRGIVYHFLRDFDKAIEDYSHAIQLRVSNLHIAYLDRGMAHEENGDMMAAADDYRKALEHRVDWPPASVRLRWVNDKLAEAGLLQ
tara:strand:+ start:2881 stop:3582 length:702 start_codon:yes stop_codon:yes gene_type:complete